MKRFHFQLQAVLALREQQERMAQRRYAQRLQQRLQVMARLRDLESEESRLWDRQRKATTQATPAALLAQWHAFGLRLQARRARLGEELEASRTLEEQARTEMMRALQKARVLKNYRARQYDMYRRAIIRAEQKVLDDIGLRPSSVRVYNAMAGAPRKI